MSCDAIEKHNYGFQTSEALSSAEAPAGYPHQNINNRKNRKRAGDDTKRPLRRRELLKEIRQVGLIETIDFTLSKWTPNRNLKEHVQSEYPLTRCFALQPPGFLHFSPPYRSDNREAVKAVKKTMWYLLKVIQYSVEIK